jgi:hypothetical protein
MNVIYAVVHEGPASYVVYYVMPRIISRRSLSCTAVAILVVGRNAADITATGNMNWKHFERAAASGVD